MVECLDVRVARSISQNDNLNFVCIRKSVQNIGLSLINARNKLCKLNDVHICLLLRILVSISL